jgi:hypothetical protein
VTSRLHRLELRLAALIATMAAEWEPSRTRSTEIDVIAGMMARRG